MSSVANAASNSYGVSIRSRSLRAYDRLDAGFYSSASILATEQIALLEASGVPIETIGAMGTASMPPRTALARAAAREDALPYLRPYDVFDYFPVPADRVSSARNAGLAAFKISEGDILQTRSGRNLGPCTIADGELAKFALSDDMIRIKIPNERRRYVLLAYLKTRLGQALIRRGRSGSVIDHLSVPDVEAVPVPVFADDVAENISNLIEGAIRSRYEGRRSLNRVMTEIESSLPLPNVALSGHVAWTMRARDFEGRLDAGYHHPFVRESRKQIADKYSHRLGDLAEAILPLRYKRYYVEREHGRPILSGRQLLQPEPVNLRYVSNRSFRKPEDYEIAKGTVVFGAVGRSEGRQAWPALVTQDRDGWLASNDVMRLVPRHGVSPGFVWLAVAITQVQAQIKALSFGSVVDHMNPWDVEDVLVPDVSDELVVEVERAWEKFALSTQAILDATALAESALKVMAANTSAFA